LQEAELQAKATRFYLKTAQRWFSKEGKQTQRWHLREKVGKDSVSANAKCLTQSAGD
jgi:hypothetical protein